MKRLNLRNPYDARIYIKEFEIPGYPYCKPTNIETNSGRTIEFKEMTDDDACIAAHLLHDIMVKASRKAVKH
jgi:hypothetical protein